MSAVLSLCRTYRMRLEREVQPNGVVAALFGVNPSTADESVNDHTIRKDMGFARRYGWRKIIKGNVFSYRATDVGDLGAAWALNFDVVGPENLMHLCQIIRDADVLVPCWGSRDKVPKKLHGHFDVLLTLIRASGKPAYTFGGFTASGDPKHPLMLGYDTLLKPL